jgi:hypothetical protein
MSACARSCEANTLLNEGTLAVGSNTALGTGTLTLADGTTLQAAANGLALANAMQLLGDTTVDTQSNTLTLSGSISGTGGLDKIGSGTLTGTGTIGGLSVGEGVIVAPGNSIGTLHARAMSALMRARSTGSRPMPPGSQTRSARLAPHPSTEAPCRCWRRTAPTPGKRGTPF